MRKPTIGFLFILVIGTNAFTQSQEPQEVATRFGALSVNDDKVLLFKGQPLQPTIEGNNSLDLGEVIPIAATDVVLATDHGGTSCPFLYYFVNISKDGAKATPPLGSCAEISSIKRTPNSITLFMPGYRGPDEPEAAQRRSAKERHVVIFRNGIVTEDGKPVR